MGYISIPKALWSRSLHDKTRQFRDTWRFHHKLEAEQLSYAGQGPRASVGWVTTMVATFFTGSKTFQVLGIKAACTWPVQKNGAPEQ